MKTFLLIVACLIMAASFSYGQSGIFKANDDTLLVNRAYSAATVDTTETLKISFADAMSVGVSVRDVARLYIGYQVKNKGYWSGIVNIDTVSATTTAGGHKAVDMSVVARSAAEIRFIIRASPYSSQGSTTPVYDFTYGIRED